jgi:tight adherence protein C
MNRPDLWLAALVGGMGGLGVWLVWTGWHASVDPLTTALARLGHGPPEPLTRANLDRRLGATVRSFDVVEDVLRRYRADLRILNRTADDQAAQLGICCLLGLGAGLVVQTPRWVAGIPVPLAVSVAVSLIGAAAGACLPVLAFRDQAAGRRRAFTHALAAYGVSVDMALQAGAGPEQALTTAAADGQGWQFVELRAALSAARARYQAPWEALAQLGDDLATPDLVEMAHAVEHVAIRGATAADTVASIANALQQRMATETERDAAKVTVRMVIPATMLLLGFLVLMGWPAVATVLDSY